MAHLAAGARLRLAVEVQAGARFSQQSRPAFDIVADQVLHHRIGCALDRAQRQAADGADELFELAAGAGINRPVAGIMRPGGQLVDQQAAIPGDEHLHRQDADQTQGIGDSQGDALGLGSRLGWYGGGGGGFVQDVVGVAVLHRRICHHRAILPAGDDHRNLEREIDEALDDGIDSADRPPGIDRRRIAGQLDLALAVITHPGGLHDAGSTDGLIGRRRLTGAAGGFPRRGGDAEAIDEILLQQPVLRDGEHAGAGMHRHELGEEGHGLDRDILPLQRHDIDRAGEAGQRLVVTVARDSFGSRHRGAGAAGFWREDMRLVPQSSRSQRRHPAKLAAAEHADSAAGGDGADGIAAHRLISTEAISTGAISTGAFATAAVWRERHSSSAPARTGSFSASTAAASSAALMAPGLPMASVPTGMPPGIWTIDSRLSIPLREWLSIGTPKTGSGVMAAAMPGRWAAPPAPAMITFRPRSLAPDA